LLKKPHRFYTWSRTKQNLFLTFVGLAWLLYVLLLYAGTLLGCWFCIIFYPTIFIFIQFIDTPFGQREGRFIYFSPLFLVEKKTKGEYIIHGGTAFDYLFVFRWQDRGEKARRQILRDFLRGMLAFTEYLEQEGLQDAKLKGSSYFFNERNAKRYGFDVVETDGIQQIILFMNYFVLLATYSFTQGRLAFPNLSAVKTVESSGEALILKKEGIVSLLTKLSKMIDLHS
jgi:hypothetical protein